MSDIHINLQVGWSSIVGRMVMIEGYTHLQVGWSSIVGRIYTFVGRIHSFVGRINTFSRSNGQYLQVGWSSIVDRIHAFVGRMYTFVWSDGHRIVQVRFTLLQVGCTNLQVYRWSSIVDRMNTFSRLDGHYLQVGWSSTLGRIYTFEGRIYAFVGTRMTHLQVGWLSIVDQMYTFNRSDGTICRSDGQQLQIGCTHFVSRHGRTICRSDSDR